MRPTFERSRSEEDGAMRSRAHVLSLPCWAATLCAVLVTSARAGDPPLFPQPVYSVPDGPPLRVLTSDVDGDGLLDLIAPEPGALQIARGRADGSFGPVESQAAPMVKRYLGLGDVDGDGDVDAVTDIAPPSGPAAGMQVLLNDGNGHFAASPWTNPGVVVKSLAVADLDGDGLDDIVNAHGVIVGSSLRTLVDVLHSQGKGFFDPPIQYELDGLEMQVETGDVDLDGDLDLVVPETLSDIVQLRNQGDGSFVPGPTWEWDTSGTPFTIFQFQLVDVTGDGRLDATWHAVVLPGQPDGSFGGAILLSVPEAKLFAHFAHFDGDANIDLAVVSYPEDTGTTILRGLGGLAFESVQHFAMQPNWLDAVDVNLDGRPDLLAHVGYATVALALEGGGFDSALPLTVDEGLSDVALADVDGDGLLDLLEAHSVGNPAFGDVQVKLQQPSGAFAVSQVLSTFGHPALHPCHADSDGFIDLVVSSTSSTDVVVALNHGDGTFSPFSTPIQAGRQILLADMDGDGHDDLVGAGSSGLNSALWVTYGDGRGSFAGATSWPCPPGVGMGQLAAADIDQDRRIDILVSSGGGTVSPILKWVNTGSGMILKSFNPPLFGSGADLRVGDFNADGDPDLILLPGQVCYGAPTGQFQPPVSLASLDGVAAHVADLDGDGIDDVLVAHEQGTAFLTHGGPAGLEPGFEGYHGALPDVIAMAVGDIDGDGRLDFVAASHDGASTLPLEDPLSIHLQQAPSPFSDLGFALAGSKGEPELTGIGTLAGGTPLSLRVTSAQPFAPARLIVGTQLLQAPFKGGVLVPLPILVLPPLPTNALGQLVFSTTWPPALPSGISLYAQAWITDAAGPAGLAATNGLKLTTP
jgi:hypothetical protein